MSLFLLGMFIVASQQNASREHNNEIELTVMAKRLIMKTNEQASLFNEVTIEECAIVSGGISADDLKDLAFAQALGTSSPSGTTTTSSSSSSTSSQQSNFILSGLVSVSGGVVGIGLVTGS